MAVSTKTQSRSIGANNHTKGIALEDMFCEYMKKELGYQRARTRAQVASDSYNRGVNVDVIAEKRSKKADLMGSIGVAFSIFGFICSVAFVFYGVKYRFSDDISDILGGCIFCLLSLGFYLLILYPKKAIQHAWVECKNQSDNISSELMQLSIMRLDSYQKTRDKEYNFTTQYFVSANEFSEGALKIAQDKNITCFKLESGNFVRVTYW